MTPLTPLPFIIEILADAYLIARGRKDVHIFWRVVMVVLVSLHLDSLSWDGAYLDFRLMALGSAGFWFFDNVLAWMRGKRGYDYEGKTKAYDKFLARVNPAALMTIRIIGFVLTAGYGLWGLV